MARTIWKNKLEASANGCAVIITNKGGLPETVTNAKIMENLNTQIIRDYINEKDERS